MQQLHLRTSNVLKQTVTDTHYLNVLEIMNRLLTIVIALFSFILGMTIAYYDATILRDPPLHYAIESRCLNYTNKDCYTKSDVELIVFGKVLNYE